MSYPEAGSASVPPASGNPRKPNHYCISELGTISAVDGLGITFSPILPSPSLAVSAPSPTDGKTATTTQSQQKINFNRKRQYIWKTTYTSYSARTITLTTMK